MVTRWPARARATSKIEVRPAALMIEVTARLMSRRATPDPNHPSQHIRGCVADLPRVGESLVIFWDRNALGRLITSPVVRVLGDIDGSIFYVETTNNVYRLVVACSRRRVPMGHLRVRR